MTEKTLTLSERWEHDGISFVVTPPPAEDEDTDDE